MAVFLNTDADIREAYPGLCGREFDSLPDLITASGGRFLFLIDEWDYIFSQENCREYHDDFLELLRDLLKDRPYVVFAYMTGVLPVKQYSTGSALNMFDEYTTVCENRYMERIHGRPGTAFEPEGNICCHDYLRNAFIP